MKELVCINCPRSCRITIDDSGAELVITGNTCKRGYDFADAEKTDPKRTICSTVRTVFSDVPVLPVRVSQEIPKNRIFDVMREIDRVTVSGPVGRGEAVIEDVLGLGVDVIATSNILKERMREGEQHG